MSGDMGQRGIQVTGNHDIDTAASEIAGHIRDGRVGSHVRWTEQDHYDEAARLRDEIMKGARALVLTELAGELLARGETALARELLARSGGNDAARVVPAAVSPMVITDDIALNMAATVLQAMGRPATADMLRRMLPAAEGRLQGEPWQEPVGKWGPTAKAAS